MADLDANSANHGNEIFRVGPNNGRMSHHASKSDGKTPTLKLAADALVTRARQLAGPSGFRKSHPDYAVTAKANLLPYVEAEDCQGDLAGGAGGELSDNAGCPAKFCAAYSSSALAVNSFAPFKRRTKDLSLFARRGFNSLAFEKKFEGGLGGTPPHLDLFMDGRVPVAIESKCLEYLRPKHRKPAFSDSYDKLVDTLFEPAWLDIYSILKINPLHFYPLDAPQLVKHYLVLRNAFGDRPVELHYVYWEPEDTRNFEVFREHRQMITFFLQSVAWSSVRFRSYSYSKLWRDWQSNSGEPWIAKHTDVLMDRYGVSLAPGKDALSMAI